MLNSSSDTFQDSTSDDSAFTDQRSQKRFRVLLQASIFPIDSVDDITVHNISNHGLMAEADVPVDLGQIVHLSFDGTTYRSGVVRWTRGRRFGLHLEGYSSAPHPLDEIEANSDADQHPRPVRLSLNIPARMSSGRAGRPAVVRNLSRSGMSIETSVGLKVGQDLLIKVGRQTPIAARIRWAENGRIGVSAEGDQMRQLITE